MITNRAPPNQDRSGLLRDVRRRAMHAHIPLAATLEVTAQCNLHCRHCYIAPPAKRAELSTAAWKAILDQMAEAGTLMLTLTGGEPLTRDDFFDLAAHARSREFSFVLFTNGTLIQPDTADRLLELQPQRVEISLLGGSAATHDALTRVPGSFERALHGATLLIERGLSIQLKTTWLQPNIDEGEQMASIAKEIGAGFRTGFLLLDPRDETESSASWRPTDRQLRDMAAKARQHRTTPSPPPRALTQEQQKALSPCGAGHAACCVDACGTVMPCVALRLPLGNLMTTPLDVIWKESTELARLRAIRVADLPTCRSCALYLRCKRCAGMALAETGTLLGPSPQACRLAAIFQTGSPRDRGTCLTALTANRPTASAFAPVTPCDGTQQAAALRLTPDSHS